MSGPGASRARFITLEGGEGAGKSTQVRRLVARLEAGGIRAVATREPGGSPGGEQIRGLLVNGEITRWDAQTEALLHFAARREHLVKTIWPALESGRWVVSDRFADSTMAYQGYALGLGRPTVESLYGLVVGDFAPDLTLILDLPAEEGLARVGRRPAAAGGEDRYERMGHDFHARLRDAFRDIAAREPERCRIVDARGDVDAVAGAIWTLVAERFKLAA